MKKTVRFPLSLVVAAAILALFATIAPAQLPSPTPTPLSKNFWDAIASGGGILGLGKTKAGGGMGGKDFTDSKQGAILVGLEIWKGEYGGDDVIRAVRPIYETPTRRITGRIYGNKIGASQKLEAREGFAVAGIEVRTTGDVVEDIRVLFWQIHESGPSLDAADAYKAESGGSSHGRPFKQLSANGKIVTGIFGGSAIAVDSIGLLYIDRN